MNYIAVFDFIFFPLTLVDFRPTFWYLSLNGLRAELTKRAALVFCNISVECDYSRTIPNTVYVIALGCRLARLHIV